MAPGLAAIRMSVPASDGLVLRGELRYPGGLEGRSVPLAVLAHQYPADRHCFEPLLQDLLERNIATLAFDTRGQGASIQGPAGVVIAPTPADFSPGAFGAAFMAAAAQVDFPRIADDIVRVAAWGVAQNFISGQVLLVGGSVGGTGVLLAAPRIARLAGVVTLGAAGAPVHGSEAPAKIVASLGTGRYPALLASSEDDPFDGASNAWNWSQGLPHVATRITPGTAHAMAIYYDVRADVLAFVEKCLR